MAEPGNMPAGSMSSSASRWATDGSSLPSWRKTENWYETTSGFQAATGITRKGATYLEWYEAGKRRRQTVPSFAEVIDAARRESIEVSAQRAGIIDIRQETEPQRMTVTQTIDEYLDFIKAHRKKRTHLTLLGLRFGNKKRLQPRRARREHGDKGRITEAGKHLRRPHRVAIAGRALTFFLRRLKYFQQ